MPLWSLNPCVQFNVDKVFLRCDGTGITVCIGAIGIIGIVKVQYHRVSFRLGDVHEPAGAVGAYSRCFVHERKEQVVLVFFHCHQSLALVEKEGLYRYW